MRNNILTIVIVVVSSISALAQQKMNALEMANYQTKTMVIELELDKDQTKEIESINLKYSEKIVVLMEANGSMFGKMGDMKRIKQNKSNELEKVLTPVQLEKYEDDVAPNMRKHMRKHMKI
ncbi:hypothetical protein [uncultured Aquimarina sp.]|uniref:hypothetical protein n=1 Tax=uncultured Aquimarina sp. TaxID=575652 RepID=UPI002617B827|nr:hypothetical protein [uncultured Aquimarina sp.]